MMGQLAHDNNRVLVPGAHKGCPYSAVAFSTLTTLTAVTTRHNYSSSVHIGQCPQGGGV